MKTSLLLFLLACCFISYAQSPATGENGEVVLENEKMRIVKFVAPPQGDVCGKDMHHHEAHLTVVLDDISIRVTAPDGKKEEVEIPAEAAIWFEAGTHAVVNSGLTDSKVLLVYLKE